MGARPRKARAYSSASSVAPIVNPYTFRTASARISIGRYGTRSCIASIHQGPSSSALLSLIRYRYRSRAWSSSSE